MVASGLARGLARGVARAVAGSGGGGPVPLRQVSGFTDDNYFASANGSGPGTIGTLRVAIKLLSLDETGLRVIMGRIESTGTVGGWYLARNRAGSDAAGAGASNTICFVAQTTDVTRSSPAYTFTAADIGSTFLFHATLTTTKIRFYLGGVQIGTGMTHDTDPLMAASASDGLWVGRYQHATGLSAPDEALIHFAYTDTVMTDAEIFADAIRVHSSGYESTIPALPSQVESFFASDLRSSTNWVGRTGGLTLTRNGSLTVGLA